MVSNPALSSTVTPGRWPKHAIARRRIALGAIVEQHRGAPRQQQRGAERLAAAEVEAAHALAEFGGADQFFGDLAMQPGASSGLTQRCCGAFQNRSQLSNGDVSRIE
jgi:hypothetical protein